MDGSPSKNQRNIDDDSSLPTLVSIDYVRVSEVVLPNDGKEGKDIKQIDETEEDISETEDEDRKIIDDESDDEDKLLIVYGTMIVRDSLGDEIVFNQYSNMMGEYTLPLPPPLPLPLQILLGGPRRAIYGDGKVIISVGFWGLLRNQGIIKEIAEGDIVWDPYKQDNKLSYNQPLQQRVSGIHGSVSVGYSVIQRALSATIDVVWTNKTNESEGEIYGTIKAVRILRGSPTERMLFDISPRKGYAKYAYPGDSLFRSPLLGQETSPQYVCLDTFPFPVQMRSPLTIQVDLRDHLSPYGQSVLGQVQFTADFGTQTKYITGKYGEVKVSMTCELPCPEQ